MSEKLKFYKGLEENLVNIIIELGAIYHCTDTGNTYIGVIDPEGEVLEDGTYPLKLDLYSTVSDIYISDDEIEGGSEFVNADTLGGFPADEYALKSHVYEKIDEININSYATKEEVNALTYENVGAAPAGDYATKDDLNAIDFPVDSVNGKTGVVELIAEDVGAPTIEYAKKVGAPHNLLDNSYFKNPVNQRNAGGTYGVWGGYTIDRWFAGEKGATLTLYEDSIGLKGGGDIAQIIPNPQKLSGKKLTFAAKIYGRIFCCSGTVNYSNSWAKVASHNVANDIAIEILTQSNNDLWVYIVNNGANETYLEWAALYEGEYTAETLPEYQPKGYAAELVECMRYYQIGSNQIVTQLTDKNGAMSLTVSFKIPMRIPPTLTLKIVAIPNVSGAAGIEQTNITIGTITVNGAVGYTSRGGLSALQPYRQDISFVASAEL